MRLLASTAIALLVACGSKSQEPAEPTPAPEPAAETAPAGPPAPAANGTGEAAASGDIDPEWKRMAKLAVDLMRKLHAVTTANAGDCDAMAEGLVTMVDENQKFIDEANSYEGNPEFNQWFAQNYQQELSKLLQEIQPALMGCKDNEKVQKAFQKFQS